MHLHSKGTWDRNMRQGYGVYYYANGDKYDGEWLSDQKHGKGVYEFKQALTKVRATFSLPSDTSHNYSNGDKYSKVLKEGQVEKILYKL